MTKQTIFQLNNHFIKNEQKKRNLKLLRHRKKNRFMGVILILFILLFIFPTYNLVHKYQSVVNYRKDIQKVDVKKKKLDQKIDKENQFAKKLKNDDYVMKYARAKYYYSKDGESVYVAPELLPK